MTNPHKMLSAVSLSALAIGSCLAFAAFAQGCTVTTTNNGPGDGGGGVGDGGNGNPVNVGFTPSNISLAGLSTQNVGDFVASKSCTIQSDTDLTDCPDDIHAHQFALVTQSDGTKVAVYVVRSFRVNATINVNLTGPNPIAIIALDTIDIQGNITTTTGNGQPAAGAAWGPSGANEIGTGQGGGSAGTSTAPTNAGGGGSYCGTGGKGGYEAAGNSIPNNHTYGTPTLIPLVGGSSGGTGGIANRHTGSGGGAIELIAANSITIEGGASINVGGQGGGFGGNPGADATGGGSGGAILLEAPQVTVTGSLLANGGGGGGGGDAAGNGHDGQDATLPPNSETDGAALTGTSGRGGKGSGLDGITSTNGEDAPPPSAAGESAGGGGGGAGRIRINTTSGSATITGGIISPSLTPDDTGAGCATQGIIVH